MWTGSGWGPVAGCYEYGSEHSEPVRVGMSFATSAITISVSRTIGWMKIINQLLQMFVRS